LKRLRQQLNVRPNSSDPTESAQATKSLGVVYDYVDESPECTELFKIWEWQHQLDIRRIEALIVEVLSKLIHQCNTALHRPHAIRLTRSILQNQSRMTCIYKNLSSGRQNTVHAALRLLTAMNHVHHTTTKELKDSFNFSLKVLPKLRFLKRKDGEAEPTNKAGTLLLIYTRTLYVQFLLAFFVRGDAAVKKEVLEMPDLFQLALKDLANDAFPLINQVLLVLTNNIIMDNELSRTSKITFFSTPFLINLLKLYSRTEPVEGSDQTVAIIVHNFMMALCTTPGVGICFQDAAWYPPSILTSTTSTEKTAGDGNKIIFNKTISQILTHLRPTENMLQQELTVAILTACPELVRVFWQKASIQLEPRLSARWLANMTLLHKITEIPVPNLYLQHTGLFASHPPPVSTIIENILPSAANRVILNKGLQHSSMLVRYFTIVEVAAVFQKAEQVVAVMQSAVKTLAMNEEELSASDESTDMTEGPANTKSSDPPAQQWASAITSLMAELRRRVPDIHIIIRLHNGIQTLAQSEAESEESIRNNLFNNGVLRLVKYYQQFLPQAVSEANFDVGKLIPSDFSTVQAGTLIHLLELLLELNDFRWSNKSLDGSSYLIKLLALFLTTAHSHIKALTRRLLSKLLGESILFQHDPSEASLWIEAIPTSNYGRPQLVEDQNQFLHFFDDCVARCLKTPYKYVDQSSAIMKALQDTSAMDVDASSDIRLALSNSQHQDVTQPFSPLLMTLLEQFQHVHARDKGVATSITAFLNRLMPSLTWNQNRTSAHAIGCLRRIQDPTNQELDAVAGLSQDKRTHISQLGSPEYLAMVHEELKESGASAITNSKTSKKVDDNSLLQLLKSSDRSAFATNLQGHCAAGVARNFRQVVEYSVVSRGSTSALVDYITTRYPFAGSIYDFSDVALLLEQTDRDSDTEQDLVLDFLRKLPFSTLFCNTRPAHLSKSLVQDLLKYSVGQTEPRLLVVYSNLVVRQLASWISSNIADEHAVNAAFDLLASLLDRSRTDEPVFEEFKNRLWESYVLRELYLSQLQAHRPKSLDAFDSRVVDLLVTVMYFSKLATLCTASDLTMILESLLKLHKQAKFSATATFNALLSTILKNLTRQGSSVSAIPVHSTAALMDLWRSQPSEELDAIVLDALQPLLLPKMVQHIVKSSAKARESAFGSDEPLLVADATAILVSLTAKSSDKKQVDLMWSLVESIPTIGLESIGLLESLLDITKDVTGEQEQQSRQKRLASWFEVTARRVINTLDKSGDAQWLEPVCDRLYSILDNHVEERKQSIDQKVLFELVSFAIEKALDNVELVRFSAYLAKHYYVETSQSSVLPQMLQTLFKHRQFSSLAMATAPTTKHAVPENFKARLAIIQLIYTLTFLEPKTCCKAGFLPMLLSCYSASTSVADQLLLAVLRITESQTIGSISNRAPVWGSGTENTKSSGALFGQAMMTESLDLIDPNMMMISAIQFPVDRELESEAPIVSKQDYDEDFVKHQPAPIYDPCFMLPLFGTYMAFGGMLDIRRFIEVNGLGYIMVALSSSDDNMRLAAYSLLDDFYPLLSQSTMREKNQLMLLMDAFRNAIVERDDGTAPPRIPAVITAFVTQALTTLLKPDHFMYPHVNKFCLQRPVIDLEDIPMFYSMFNSSSENHRKERVWMLRLLATSLKTSEDYKLFRRRHVVDLLVAFFNSQLSEPLSKKIVIEILFNATAIPKASLQLITQNAFLSWIHSLSAINPMSSDNEFALVPARLLLRAVLSCPKVNILWMNGIWKNQVSGIATTLLRQLSTFHFCMACTLFVFFCLHVDDANPFITRRDC
ncbi:MAG: ribosome 60S biogenesis N-terminal-domain-containing protein, partial [Linnemannia gamsii]